MKEQSLAVRFHISNIKDIDGVRYFSIKCPFCDAVTSVTQREFVGDGKRCNQCDAVHYYDHKSALVTEEATPCAK